MFSEGMNLATDWKTMCDIQYTITTSKELDRENRKTRKRIGSKTYSVLYSP